MRAKFLIASLFLVPLLAGCSPEEEIRSPEFYMQPENASEYAEALEICKKAGFTQKEMCAPVWQAKAHFDIIEQRERQGSERGDLPAGRQSR